MFKGATASGNDKSWEQHQETISSEESENNSQLDELPIVRLNEKVNSKTDSLIAEWNATWK